MLELCSYVVVDPWLWRLVSSCWDSPDHVDVVLLLLLSFAVNRVDINDSVHVGGFLLSCLNRVLLANGLSLGVRLLINYRLLLQSNVFIQSRWLQAPGKPCLNRRLFYTLITR